MRAHEGELAAAAARLVFVGSGTPAMAADFAGTHGRGHVVLSDVGRGAFAAAGMRRTLGSTLHWRVLRNLLRALRRGFRQRGVQGDPWQQGGVLVFDAGGRLLHEQAEAVAGDPLDAAAMVAAARAA